MIPTFQGNLFQYIPEPKIGYWKTSLHTILHHTVHMYPQKDLKNNFYISRMYLAQVLPIGLYGRQ